MTFRSMLPIHRWAALTLGLIALASALTGAGMAFRKQLEPLVYPRAARSSCAVPVSLDEILAAAEMAHPNGKVDYLRILRDPRQPVAVRWLNKDTLYIDRCSGQVAAEQNRYGGVFGVMEWIHRGRWVPDPVGDWIMGLGALTLLLLLLGVGLYLWWPRKNRRFIDNFKLNRKLRKGPAFDMGLHRTVGGWVAIPLAISATTGLPNAFSFVHDAIVSLDGTPAQPKLRSAPHGPFLPVSKIDAVVEQASPNPREVLIHVAHKPSDVVEIYVIAADAPHANARTYLYLDSHDGRVLKFTPYSAMGIGSRIYYWTLSVHTGEVGGVFGQSILLLGAIGALVLGYTGILTWFRRRRNKKQSAGNARRPAAPALLGEGTCR